MPSRPGLRPTKSTVLSTLALLLSATSTTLAQEHGELGRMWTFENPPLAYLDQQYGFKPDQKWLDALRLGSLRLGGEQVLTGSASFVSPKGLIMTSHQSVRDAVTQTRKKDLEILKTGFVATTREEEFRLRSRGSKWLTAAQLVKIFDVTNKVNTGVVETENENQAKKRREANKKAILAAARKADPTLVPQLVRLYRGLRYQLYQYKVYQDIRLVVLPNLQTAHFGGDPDNFTYPRYSLDFAFLRAYENGKPADTTRHYFKWKPGGAKKGELVFVSGNPAATKRWLTKAQLEFERDLRLPMKIERLTNSFHIMIGPGSGTYSGTFDPENPSRHWAWVRTGNLKSEDNIKAARGNLHGLQNAELMSRKAEAEKAFKQRVMADKALAKQHGDLWDRIAGVIQQRRQHEARAQFQRGAGLLGIAVDIVRLCDPNETEERRKQARKNLDVWAGGTIAFNYDGLAHVRDHFIRSRNWLSEDDTFFTKVLGGKSPDEFVDMMQQRSPNWLGHPEQREALVKSGWEGIRESKHPVIIAALELVPLMRENEKLGAEIDAQEEGLEIELARAMLACYGTSVPPDATNTLRFTDGVVSGFPCNGTLAPCRTTFYGLYGRNAEFDNTFPFNLPETWLARRDKIDMAKPVNFVSTNDISIGSSGSAVVNRKLEVVGLVADGNIESLHNDFAFKDDVPRAVSAHVDGIMEALVKIYNADHVARELTRAASGVKSRSSRE